MRRAALYRWGIVLAFALILEGLCRTQVISSFVMIPPSQMAVALFEIIRTSDWFWTDGAYTARNLLVAVLLSMLGGFACGTLIHGLPRLRRVLNPLLASYYAVPTFVLYPLLIVVFGLGPASLIVMGSIFGVVAMIVATLTALDRIPAVYLKTARVYRIDPLRTIALIRLPAATPHLFAGVKLAVAYCMIGVIAGEFILATAGVGRRLSLAYNNFDNPTMYGLLLLIIVVSALLTGSLNVIERRLRQRWMR